MEKIRCISTTYVQPKNQRDLCTRIELTPSDVLLLPAGPIQKGLFFRKPQPDHEEDLNEEQSLKLIEHLRASFSRTLDIFHPLAGRLAVTENEDDNTISFSWDCNGAGAEFVHAAAEGVTVANILDPVYVPDHIVYSLFLMNGVANYEGTSNPLLAVQVTELVDGIFIGLTMNHSVCDGTCFWKFFNTWSEISRSNTNTSTMAKPIFSREFLEGIIPLPIRIPFFQYQNPKDKIVLPTEQLQQRVFHFSKVKIAELKSKANAQMGTTKISSLQALMGHLWASITRTRRLLSSTTDDEEITKYVVIVGLRQRLVHPSLSDHYLGNAVLFGTATSTVGELLEGSLGCAAIELNKMIALQTEQEAMKFLKGFVENPSTLKISDVDRKYSLATGSSPRFNVYGNDFGWGKPVAVRSGSGNKFDGKLTVFAGAEEGSITFEVCLSSRTLQALAEDAEFMESVAV